MRFTLSRSFFVTALILAVASATAGAPARNSKASEPVLKVDTPVSELTGRYLAEWSVIAGRHPNADLPGWLLRPGWGPAAGCMGPFNQHSFMRICPENGALSLDWAQVTISGGRLIKYSEGAGPKQVDPELMIVPKMTREQAWERLLSAIRLRGVAVPVDYPAPEARLLRHIRDGKRVRLCHEFALKSSHRAIYADVNSAEVGGMVMTYLGAHFFDVADPLNAFKLGEWIKPGDGTHSPD